MKTMACLIVGLSMSLAVSAQDHIALPRYLECLQDQKAYYQKKVRDHLVRRFQASFHYEESYGRAILDSIEIMCVPTFKIKARKGLYRDFTTVPELLASLKPCNDFSDYFFFKDGQYFGGSQDTPFYTDSGISGDSLAHTKFGTLFKKAAMDIQGMNPESLFTIQNKGGIWLILPDHSLIVYDMTFDRFYQPQEYLDRTPEELEDLFNKKFNLH